MIVRIDIFHETIEKCARAVKEFGVDLVALIENSKDVALWENTMNCMVGITAVQASVEQRFS